MVNRLPARLAPLIHPLVPSDEDEGSKRVSLDGIAVGNDPLALTYVEPFTTEMDYPTTRPAWQPTHNCPVLMAAEYMSPVTSLRPTSPGGADSRAHRPSSQPRRVWEGRDNPEPEPQEDSEAGDSEESLKQPRDGAQVRRIGSGSGRQCGSLDPSAGRSGLFLPLFPSPSAFGGRTSARRS